MKRFYGLFLYLLLITVWWISPVSASENLPSQVQVSQNSARSNFPDNILFEFKASTSKDGPIFKKAELSYRLVGEVATTVRPLQPGKVSGAEFSFSYKADTQKEYIPPGTRLTYYWTLYDEASKAYSTTPQEFTYNDNRFSFQELKSGVITVRWYQGDDNFGKTVLNKAVATIEKLGKLYRVEAKTPINLTIYPDRPTMFTALPPNTAEWVGGQAMPSLGTIILTIAPGNLTEVGRSVPHEISHQVIYQATKNPYNVPPAWLDEGLAVSSQDQIEGFLVEAFERAVDKYTLYPLRVLNGSFPADGQDSYLAYAQSYKVVQYIQSKYGQEALAKILASFKEGVSYDEAVRRGLGIGLDELDQEWKKSINYPLPSPEATVTPVASPASQAIASSSAPETLNPGGSAPAAKSGESFPQAAPVPGVTPAPSGTTRATDPVNPLWAWLAGGVFVTGALGAILTLVALRRGRR